MKGNANTADCDVIEEVVAQMEWFVSHLDRLPSHFDGHNHVHVIPRYAKLISEVMQQYGVLKYRLPM
mgnify:CR=1 FL=1